MLSLLSLGSRFVSLSRLQWLINLRLNYAAVSSGLVLVGTLRYNIRLWQLITLLLVVGAVFLFAREARQSEERTLSSFIKRGFDTQDDSKPLFGAMQYYSQSGLYLSMNK